MAGKCRPPVPINDFTTCRSVKSTPLHKSQAECGAVFEQQPNLFERAAWFDASPVDDDYGMWRFSFFIPVKPSVTLFEFVRL